MAVSVAVLGAGRIGRKHAETLALKVPEGRLAVIADPAEEAARAASEAARGAPWTTDFAAALADPAVAAVVIAAPTNLHAELICQAAAAGKQIFCEKPIALTLAEADEALAAVREAGVLLQIGFQRRFDPAYERAHAAVKRGDLGRLYLLRSTTRDPEPPPENYLRAAPSILTDTTTHDVDMLRWLAGSEVTEVFAAGAALIRDEHAKRGLVDTTVCTLRFESGALGFIDNCWHAAYGYDVRTEVLGAGGALEVGHAQETALARFSREGVTRDYPYWFLDRFGPAYERELADFVRCVAERAAPRVTGEDARETLHVAVAAVQSLNEGRPVRLR
jgi:myo-inositol 2-dehydrogenase / D-chiro-inositol 1-dehydrogenase